MKRLTITKEFNAPIEKIWDALTNPETIKKYWAPEGMETPFVSIDKLEVGGVFRYCMKAPSGFEQWVKGIYQEIRKPMYFSYIETLSDADGNEVPPSYYGHGPDMIVRSLTEFSLEEQGDMTIVKLIVDSYGDDKGDELAVQGWKSMLDKLAAVV